jgi:hypothetical protein
VEHSTVSDDRERIALNDPGNPESLLSISLRRNPGDLLNQTINGGTGLCFAIQGDSELVNRPDDFVCGSRIEYVDWDTSFSQVDRKGVLDLVAESEYEARLQGHNARGIDCLERAEVWCGRE